MNKAPTNSKGKKPADSIPPKIKTLKSVKLHNNEEQFPIVGIGASAGGIEALELFFNDVNENSGMAYVVIQHLDPTQKGMMPELLQRFTPMKVNQAKDRLKIKPNCVYVIPPNKSMSILNGSLHLFEPVEARGLRLPVDFFFRSLAEDQQEKSIGVILSGMGSDGSLGLRSIKERGGIVLVQDPASAKYDGMPRSALEAVMADIIAPAGELPEKLLAFLKHIPFIKSISVIDEKNRNNLDKIIIMLREQTGHDFSLYKKSTIYRRVERRMGVHKIDKISLYIRFLQENPKELEILFKELLIGVTNFFRDAAVWECLKEKILPSLFEKLPNRYILRAWVPACSTGEEAYTLAIVIKEALDLYNHKKSFSFQIFATDIDSDAITKARKGVFAANITNDISIERLNRFFIPYEDGYCVKPEIREMIVFAQQGVTKDPPFTKLDLLSCRNLLIYLESELQRKLISLFHYSLNTEGILILGSSESTGDNRIMFESIEAKLRLYKKVVSAVSSGQVDFSTSVSKIKINEAKKPGMEVTNNIQSLVDQLMLQEFSPASVLVNDKGDILYITGSTGNYLEPASGKANMNIFAMARPGLRNELPIAFHKALQNYNKVTSHNIRIHDNHRNYTVDLTIQKIEKPDPLKDLIMIVFTDVPDIVEKKLPNSKAKKPSNNHNEEQLRIELQGLKDEMKHSFEEMQTSQEELKSANEELQSTNEELQSTNEELTTSKEEMQSLNEELQTVNLELQSKVDEFTQVSNDMTNLLNSTDIATLFLDRELNIRRFTKQTTKIFKLKQSDIGRKFTDQVSDLKYPEILDDVHDVVSTLIFVEKDITTNDGRWFSIRIMPYRTIEDKIDGLVITFTDITKAKNLEAELNKTISILRSHNLDNRYEKD